MMDGKHDLRPCPFCGGEAVLKTYRDNLRGDAFAAMCQKTDCPGRTYRKRATSKAAAEAWNRRAEPENRMLTLEETTESGEPVWLEGMNTIRIAQIYLSPGESLAECKTIGRAYPKYLYTGDYAKLWRCWLRKPTAEEMASTPWEE